MTTPNAPVTPETQIVNVVRFERAPCYLCGYNGANYFQPATHACAADYHTIRGLMDQCSDPLLSAERIFTLYRELSAATASLASANEQLAEKERVIERRYQEGWDSGLRHGDRLLDVRHVQEMHSALSTANEQLAANICDACAGTGNPVSGLPCMCGGTGKMSDAARYLREQLAAERALFETAMLGNKQWQERAEQAEARLRVGADALEQLIARLDLVHANPIYEGVWTSYQIHRGPYSGPKYELELIAAKQALAAIRGGTPT